RRPGRAKRRSFLRRRWQRGLFPKRFLSFGGFDEVAHSCLKLAKARDVERAVDLAAFATSSQQSGPAQQAQVPGSERLADHQTDRQLGDTDLAFVRDESQDLHSTDVAEGSAEELELAVSHRELAR